mgnify:CR=1 FL=1
MYANDKKPPEPVGHSQFAMWRCIISMAHADGEFSKEEEDHLRLVFSKMGLSDEQRETLEEDMESPEDIDKLLPQINEPKFRSQVVYFARILAAKDGNICPNEQEMLDKIHAKTVGQVDIDAMRDEIQRNINDEMIKHDIEIAKNRPRGLIGETIDKILLNLGIDILE